MAEQLNSRGRMLIRQGQRLEAKAIAAEQAYLDAHPAVHGAPHPPAR
jgi:hypothetical protein